MQENQKEVQTYTNKNNNIKKTAENTAVKKFTYFEDL